MKTLIKNVQVYIVEANKYLQIDDPNENDLRQAWPEISARYPDYERWLCLHNTELSQSMLDELNAVLGDDCIELRLYPDTFICEETPNIEIITEATFPEFAAYHDSRDHDIHWTGERIGRDLSMWKIFCLRSADGKISDYILMSLRNPQTSEFYCIDTPSVDICKKLISVAAKFAFDSGRTNVLFQATVIEDDMLRDAALDVGFVVKGFYKGYEI